MSLPTKKDPVSMKLRVANMKSEDVQNHTKQLEEESRKMEERLRELKLAMNKEKELREQRGGGYWKSGKEGNLSTHAKDVLNKPAGKPRSAGSSSKGKRVKVLKDEPIKSDKSKDPPKPGTMSFLAQRGVSKGPIKIDGPVCGQCEVRAAVLTCQECAELYCSGCFTAFHLKGALAKHHSIPVTKTSPGSKSNKKPTDRQPEEKPLSKIVWEQNDSIPTKQDNNYYKQEPHNQEPAIIENSLLDGEYDEKEAALSFQQALAEWRKENTEPSTPQSSVSSKGKISKQQTINRRVKVVSPVATPRVNVDEGTSTSQGSIKPVTSFQPEFHTSDITYAERLLLKKNRRSDAPEFPSGHLASTNGYSDHFDDFVSSSVMDGDEMMNEPICFDSLLATVQSGASYDQNSQKPSSRQTVSTIVDIQEIQDDGEDSSLDSESHYTVDEDPEQVQDRDRKSSRVFPSVIPACMPPSVSKSNARDSSVISNSVQIVEVTESIEELAGSISEKSVTIPKSDKKGFKAARPMPEQKQKPTEKLIHNETIIKSAAPTPRGKTPRTKRESSSLKSADTQHRKGTDNSTENMEFPVMTDSVKELLSSKRPGSGLGQPTSQMNRPVSRQNTSFHLASGMRPKSVAEKAMFYYGEGTLTKTPSSALTDIISKYKTTSASQPAYTKADYVGTLGEFFTAGVAKEFTERTLTPRKDKSIPGDPLKKHQLSNKVYAMSHKSWRPDSSLADNVDNTDVQKYCDEFDSSILADFEMENKVEETAAEAMPVTTLRYTWSASREHRNNGLERVTGLETERSDLNESLDITNSSYNTTSRVITSTTTTTTNQLPGASSARGMAADPLASGEPIRIPRRPQTGSRSSRRSHVQMSVRRSATMFTPRGTTPIVVDGDDMTQYDDVGIIDIDNNADLEAIDDLELELASQTGRVTADGRVSRLVLDDTDEASDSVDEGIKAAEAMRSAMTTPDTHRDIDRLRESMMDDFEENELLIMQDEVMRVSLL